MIDLKEITKCVIEGNASKVTELVSNAIKEGILAKDILDKGLVPGIQKVGELFVNRQYYLPELMVSGETMTKALEILEPELSKAKVRPVGKYAIGTVMGDVHDIGKNIVIMMLKANGWEVTDLGLDVSPQDFCSVVEEGDYHILGMSALLTTTMLSAVETIDALKEAGLRNKIKIMVGGAPTTKEWADKIGADGYAVDAPTAVKVALGLIK